ncbi:MAG: hypothetical protein JKX91_06335 [Rhizobiaceae bacterium]|nr:hypothetical protein [Rhizobiaceae bacterium]
MNNGWVKLHRGLIDWEWYDDINVCRLFIHCLLRANHKENNWRGKTIGRGQFWTSLDTLSMETKLTKKQIRLAFSKLEMTGEVASKGQATGRMITIVNYDSYQEEGRQRADEGQTEGRQRAANKNVNNEKNDKKEDITPFGLEGESIKKVDNCPHESIAKLYMEILPELPRVAKLTDKRKKSLGAAWRSDIKCQTLEFWEGYFEAVRKSDFLMGRGVSNSWMADFDFVINQNKMIKVIEGAYE